MFLFVLLCVPRSFSSFPPDTYNGSHPGHDPHHGDATRRSPPALVAIPAVHMHPAMLAASGVSGGEPLCDEGDTSNLPLNLTVSSSSHQCHSKSGQHRQTPSPENGGGTRPSVIAHAAQPAKHLGNQGNQAARG